MTSVSQAQSFICSRSFLGLLRLLVAIQCVGYARQLDGPSSLNDWLLTSMGDRFVTELDSWVVRILWASVFALPVLGLIRWARRAGRRWLLPCDAALLCFVAAWGLTEAFFSWRVNLEDSFYATNLLGHAIRYAGPVVLLLFLWSQNRNALGEWILRVALAATFIGHGIGAWMAHFEFVDLMLGSMDTFLGEDWEAWEVREEFAKAALPWIAVQDFCLAGLIVLPNKRLRSVALWMAVWGFGTTVSRVTAFGWEYWPDFCLRICHGGIPLLLWLHWRSLSRNRTLR